MLGLPYPLKTVLHEMQRLFIPFGLCSNLLNEVKMYVKARYFLILVLDIIGREEEPDFGFLPLRGRENGTSPSDHCAAHIERESDAEE